MGCDDHTYLEWNEIGSADDPFWELVAKIELGRYYGLYDIMAGVRSDGKTEPIFPPRGLPGKLSIDVLADYHDWQPDAHHETWFNVEELREIQQRFMTRLTEYGRFAVSHPVLTGAISMMDILNEGEVARTRLVVWWDN